MGHNLRLPGEPRPSKVKAVARATNLKHAGCGGQLIKADVPGRYRCVTCGGVIALGRSGNYGGAEGYIHSQLRKGRL